MYTLIMPNKILEELATNKKNQRIGVETFATDLSDADVKKGKSTEEISKEMKKASRENLIRFSSHASFC